jgi:DNA-binding transcriptional MerR regulator
MEATEHFSTRYAARILQTTEAQVRRLARLGGLVPKDGAGGRLEFSFQELILLRTTRGLLDAGIPARRVQRVWSSLRRQLSDDLPLTSIRVLANGDRAVAWDGSTSWQPDSGQFLLDFGAGEMTGAAAAGAADEDAVGDTESRVPALVGGAASMRSAAIVPWGGREDASARIAHRGSADAADADSPTALDPANAGSRTALIGSDSSRELSAEQWFHLGCELEEMSPVEARQAYQQALAADPNFADAHINLGRLDHEAGELGKAEARYQIAVRCAPDDATCHFNLGVLLEDRGRPDEAVFAYQRAIACDPEAADAHHNLGLLLESRGRRADAVRHLMIARELYAHAGGH